MDGKVRKYSIRNECMVRVGVVVLCLIIQDGNPSAIMVKVKLAGQDGQNGSTWQDR